MTDKIKTEQAPSSRETSRAILFLPPPPAPWGWVDWYAKKIAGVPFLLRNILSLQRGGVNHLVLYLDNAVQAGLDLSRRVAGDSRVQLQLDWVTDPERLAAVTRGSDPLLLLNGSALYPKTEIEEALRPEAPRGGRRFELEYDEVPVLWTQLRQATPETFPRMLEQRAAVQHPGSVSRPLQSLTWMPGDPQNQVTRESDFAAVHHRLLQTSGLSNDSFMDRWVTRSMSRQITRLFLPTPLTPNQITLLSLALGLAAAGCFGVGTYGWTLAGAGLLVLSSWVDCTDGEVARLKFQESRLGGRLDIVCDNLVHGAVFLAIGVGLYRATGRPGFLVAGGLAVLGTVLCALLLSTDIIEKKARAGEAAKPASGRQNLSDQLANRDFVYLVLVLALLGNMEIFILLTAAGTNLFALYLVYTQIRLSRVSTGGSPNDTP